MEHNNHRAVPVTKPNGTNTYLALRRFGIEYQRSIALHWIKRRLLYSHVGYMLMAGMLQAFLLTGVCRAMDLTHYDMDSLVYLSTDIVVAIVSQSPEHGFSAVVTETIYGTLRPGDRVEQLSPFLSFFKPMQAGLRVILFLDRRPHQYDFLHSEAAKAPFAVPPSGIYLIDEYEHVHEYYQQNNPGPYVAQGYSFFDRESVPSKEQDMALPTLDEKLAMIRASLKSVQRIRPLLDKTATRDDVPALFALLKQRVDARHSCSINDGEAMAEHISQQIRNLNDPKLLLRLQQYHVDPFLDIRFVHPTVERNKQLESSRVGFLLKTLSNRKESVSLRIAAAEILLGINGFHSGQQKGPARPWIIDNEWLAPSAAQLRKIAQKILEDKAADARLRSLCLRFVSLEDQQSVADIKVIYARTHSEDLRFEIENYFLEFDQELYETLRAPGGPVSSLVTKAPERSCFRPSASTVAFHVRYREVHGKVVGVSHYFALINLQTGQRFAPAKVNYLGGWGGVEDGESWFELGQVSDLSPGKYSLALEYGTSFDEIHTVSSGYPATFSVLDTRTGRKIVVK